MIKTVITKSVVWFFLLLANYAQSQQYVGYLGMKNTATLNFSAGFSLMSQTGKNDALKKFSPVHSFEFLYEHALKSKFSLGFSFGKMSGLYVISTAGQPILLGGSAPPSRYFSGKSNLSLTSVGLHVRKYISKYGGMAPNGVYLEYRFQRHHIRFSNTEVSQLQPDPNTGFNIIVPISQPESTHYYSFDFCVGKHILFPRKHGTFVLDIGSGFAISNYLWGNLISLRNSATVNNFEQAGKIYFSNLQAARSRIGFGYLF